MCSIQLTFIIPVYNGAQTIVAAMDSVFALPLSGGSVEIIVVDDCSQDNTVDVVERYIQSHSNVILLRQKENHRQGACRNRGLEVARGRYVAYLDADDVILPGVCKALEKALEHDLDMCGYEMKIQSMEGKAVLSRMPELRTAFITGIEFIKLVPRPIHFFIPTCFLHKRSFLLSCNHPFVENHRVEDPDFSLYHLIRARKVGTVQNAGYFYYYFENSTIHSLSIELLSDYVCHAERVNEIMDEFRCQYPELPGIYRNNMGTDLFSSFSYLYMARLRLTDLKLFYSEFDYERRSSLTRLDFAECDIFQKTIFRHKNLSLAIFCLLCPLKHFTISVRGFLKSKISFRAPEKSLYRNSPISLTN